MGKHTNCEVRIGSESPLNVKICTSNKLNPDTLYMDITAYIVPLYDRDDFDEDMLSCEKEIRKYVGERLKGTDMLRQEYIMVMEAASGRMGAGKNTYINIQVYMRPSMAYYPDFRKDFKDSAAVLYEDVLKDIAGHISDSFTGRGYLVSKTKVRPNYVNNRRN